jgi:hypothetical protein
VVGFVEVRGRVFAFVEGVGAVDFCRPDCELTGWAVVRKSAAKAAIVAAMKE